MTGVIAFIVGAAPSRTRRRSTMSVRALGLLTSPHCIDCSASCIAVHTAEAFEISAGTAGAASTSCRLGNMVAKGTNEQLLPCSGYVHAQSKGDHVG